jgi:DNA-binding response OmpR family regulator
MIKKILIIDDDKIFSKILRDGLSAGGQGKYEVSATFDGEEGLVLAEKERPDLIMLDLVMPKLGGIEFLKKLRAEEWGKDIPVIVETQLSDMVSMGEGITYGVRGYVVKSDYSLDAILTQIEDVFR